MQDPERGAAPPATLRRDIVFPPYRLDLDAGLLRAGDRAIALRPKTWSVLCYLAQRPGILVTKDELLDVVWKGVTVTEATLTKSIGATAHRPPDDSGDASSTSRPDGRAASTH